MSDSGRPIILRAIGSTSRVVGVGGYRLPTTFTLKSADATRKIEFSTDGGVEYFIPIYDTNTATMLVVVASAGLSHVKFTGLTADYWSIA